MIDPERDLQPPSDPHSVPRPAELAIGWDIETLYQHYGEALTILIWGISADLTDQFAEKARRLANHLADHGLQPDQLAILDIAVQNLTRRSDPRPADLDGWVQKQVGVAGRLETLMGQARAVLPPNRRRYYDLGVMLNRLSYCAAMLRNSAANPGTVLELYAASLDHYRKELARVAAGLVMFCLTDSGDRARDPEYVVLDDQFGRFALWLADWKQHATDPDDVFFECLNDITHHAGFYRLDGSYTYAIQLPQSSTATAEPEGDLGPLGVPRPDSSMDALLTTWQALRQVMLTDPHRFLDQIVGLLDLSRYVVGPAHPITLEIQIDLAYAYAANNQVGRAVATCSDTAATAEHYYRRGHPTTYSIFAAAHKFLTFADPVAARQFYDDRLRRLLETPPEDVPERLRQIHAALVQRLTSSTSAGDDSAPRA